MPEQNAIILIGLALLVFVVSLISLSQRRAVQKAREKGLWPEYGEVPTDENVRKLALAGEKILAIKLYRQLHGGDLKEAKAAVEKMMANPPQS